MRSVCGNPNVNFEYSRYDARAENLRVNTAYFYGNWQERQQRRTTGHLTIHAGRIGLPGASSEDAHHLASSSRIVRRIGAPVLIEYGALVLASNFWRECKQPWTYGRYRKGYGVGGPALVFHSHVDTRSLCHGIRHDQIDLVCLNVEQGGRNAIKKDARIGQSGSYHTGRIDAKGGRIVGREARTLECDDLTGCDRSPD